jgi:CYTH domain-containing protein
VTHKYARVELERRFLLAGVPEGEVARVDIEDRYLDGTRVRLRRQDQRGGATLYKLTQKIPARGPHGQQGTLTTFYLSPEEHAVFAALPAARLRKTRLSIAPYGVDVFAGPLEGLVLAEAEFASVEEATTFVPAAFCVAEVSDDRRFTGGSLARASGEEVAAWAVEYGVTVARGAGARG